MCGVGGDLLAIVWDGDVNAYRGVGRAPAGATLDAVRQQSGSGTMPTFGPHPCTVPGAVDGWFTLLERWGTGSFGELAAAAIALADDGFTVSAHAAPEFVNSRAWFRDYEPWTAQYGDIDADTHFRQPASARTLRALADDGPDAFYRGPIGASVAESVQAAGGHLEADDLAAHAGEWCDPYSARFRDLDILELPPPTQGATVLEALRILDGCAIPDALVARTHLQIEIVKAALADRDAWISDPDHMPVPATALFADEYVAERRAAIDLDRAADPAPGHPQRGGTAYLCAADADGLMISLIQSNFAGFGSGVRYGLLGSGWLPCLVRGFLRDGLLRLGLPPDLWYDVALVGLGEVAATANDEHRQMLLEMAKTWESLAHDRVEQLARLKRMKLDNSADEAS